MIFANHNGEEGAKRMSEILTREKLENMFELNKAIYADDCITNNILKTALHYLDRAEKAEAELSEAEDRLMGIVYCKECIYWYKGSCSNGENDLGERKQSDYCSFAKIIEDWETRKGVENE